MNYYPFHIGDYLSATRHLSWEEDAAYRRLLDTYYTTEKALPADLRAVCRLVLATTEAQREAVSVVLNEYFVLTDSGWVNGRADAEIDAMREKQQKQRDKANKRWHKPAEELGNASAMPQHKEADAVALKSDADAMPPTPTPTPTPTPINKERESVAKAPRPLKKCPSDFLITQEMQSWATDNAVTVDLQAETAKFMDYTFSTARSDWVGTWRNWMRKAQEYAEKHKPDKPYETPYAKSMREKYEKMTPLIAAKNPNTIAKPINPNDFLNQIEASQNAKNRIAIAG